MVSDFRIYLIFAVLLGACASPSASRKLAFWEIVDAQLWQDAGFENVIIKSFQPRHDPSKAYKREFEFTALIFRNTAWSPEEIKRRGDLISDIYAQCGVSISTETIVEVDLPRPELLGSRSPRCPNSKTCTNITWETAVARMLPAKIRPIVLYVGWREEDTGRGHPALDFDAHPDEPPGDIGFKNTAWISSEVLSKAYQAEWAEKYNVDAHELAHVMLNSFHYGEKHLMSGFETRTNLLGDKQCDQLRSSPFLRRLD